MWRRKPAGPLGTGRLLCAYCVSDYLGWQRDSPQPEKPPVVYEAVTVLPATVDGYEGGAAVCVAHLRPLLRTRQLLGERRRAPEAVDGATVAQRNTPLPRLLPEATSA